MANKGQVTKALQAVGACWAVRTDKFCGADDPLEDQMAGRKTYHVHPDASYPHQDHILRFASLRAIMEWVGEVKAARKAHALQ